MRPSPLLLLLCSLLLAGCATTPGDLLWWKPDASATQFRSDDEACLNAALRETPNVLVVGIGSPTIDPARTNMARLATYRQKMRERGYELITRDEAERRNLQERHLPENRQKLRQPEPRPSDAELHPEVWLAYVIYLNSRSFTQQAFDESAALYKRYGSDPRFAADIAREYRYARGR